MLENEIVQMARDSLKETGDIPRGLLYSLAFSSVRVSFPVAVRLLETMRPAESVPYDFRGLI